ncbi:hypothetical protein MTR_0203s0040 [Medicago truncatula]|uniref:Uncharacterized protein n=1 Tax=Medicago truncatula TaxID=3880 RepID=A0A072TFU1_MEDTR|nr:hypothetical protein MTR_0203s0040 [Medicago truncatula]
MKRARASTPSLLQRPDRVKVTANTNIGCSVVLNKEKQSIQQQLFPCRIARASSPQHIEHKYNPRASSPQLKEQKLTGHQALNLNEYAWTQQLTTLTTLTTTLATRTTTTLHHNIIIHQL